MNSEANSASKRTAVSPALSRGVAAVGVFLASAISEILAHFHHASIALLLADNFLFAALAGFIVFYYEKRRLRYLKERLAVVAEMNHHVRNALQVISYSVHAQEDEKVAGMLRDAGQRIDWALREILGRKATADLP